MIKESLKSCFETMNKGLKSDEILALEKFTGLSGRENLLESFFQELITCNVINKPFYFSDNWKSLTKIEKLVLYNKIMKWYQTILLCYPDYLTRCTYTPEDDQKLKIVLNRESLESKEDYHNYGLYLEKIKKENIYEESSSELINWIDKQIKYNKSQIEENFPSKDIKIQNIIDSEEDHFIFPDDIIVILSEYHKEFNGRIYEELSLDEFLNIFREDETCQIKFKPGLKGHFKYSISKIERHHTLDSDFNEWFSKKIGGPYKNSKGMPKKNKDVTELIESFFRNRLKQYES